tara:strand:- start:435 stop:1049 length:615 start_codon:yes stop_codon:yes gene_type:complete
MIKVSDNILTKKQEQDLQFILGDKFPWYSAPASTCGRWPYLSHMFLNRDSEVPNSHYFPIVSEVIKHIIINKFKLPFNKFMRLNANWSFGPEGRTTDPHADHPWDHKVFILYLTQAKGETIIYKEKIKYKGEDSSYMVPVEKFKGRIAKRIHPKKNRAAIFPGLNYHCHKFAAQKVNDTVDPSYRDGDNKLNLNRRVILIASFS